MFYKDLTVPRNENPEHYKKFQKIKQLATENSFGEQQVLFNQIVIYKYQNMTGLFRLKQITRFPQ